MVVGELGNQDERSWILHWDLEMLESTVEVQGERFLDLLERSVSWKLSYLEDHSTMEVGFNGVLGQRKRVMM